VQKVLLLHGWGGSDYPHWQSWLACELTKAYGTVSFPLLHNPHFPSKNRQMRQIREILEDLRPDTVICHSLANILWFHLCNEGGIPPIKRLLLVSPPSLHTRLEILKKFFPVDLPADLYAKEAMLVTSTTDPYLTPKEAKELQERLKIPMKILENAGHINDESGYGPWPWVLKWVQQNNKGEL